MGLHGACLEHVEGQVRQAWRLCTKHSISLRGCFVSASVKYAHRLCQLGDAAWYHIGAICSICHSTETSAIRSAAA